MAHEVANMTRKVHYVLVATGAIYGCASSASPMVGSLPVEFPHHTAPQIIHRLAAPGDSLTAFHAQTTITVRGPEQGGTFQASIHERRGDSLHASVSLGIGLAGAQVLATPDSFFLYDLLRKRVQVGPLSAVKAYVPHLWPRDDWLENLLGLMSPAEDVPWTVETDESQSHYYLRDPSNRTLFVINPSLWRVVRYEETDEADRLVERRVFSEFESFDGMVLPSRLMFQRPGESTRASVHYRSLTPNPGESSFSFDVPKDFKRIPIGE